MKQKWKNLTHLEDCTDITDLKAVIATKKIFKSYKWLRKHAKCDP